jgi:2-keto-4-pentenoate hydratase/2-oxohepta-3-ene-1,7-dioic acid hydratase in catechol pathway
MKPSRRTFLKRAGLAGTAALAGAGRALTPSAAAAGPTGTRTEIMLRGVTLVTLKRGNEMSLGVKTDRGILDVKKAEQALKLKAPTTIDDVFEGRGSGEALARLVARAPNGKGSDALFLAEGSFEYGPCVTDPEKIICIGLNYRKHAAETGNPVPKVPILFNKYNSSLSGHRSVVKVSQEPAEKFDYEVELVMVMGRTARNVSEADALSYVFGYCTGNDLTARDLQSRTSQWMLGKSADNFGPIGPYLVTADQVPDPNELKLECRVNGEVRQSSNTADMVFDCKALVSYISRHFTLRPGDIIFTGTPEGVIAGYPKDKQVWLKPGDKVTSMIEKLGTQEITLG